MQRSSHLVHLTVLHPKDRRYTIYRNSCGCRSRCCKWSYWGIPWRSEGARF